MDKGRQHIVNSVYDVDDNDVDKVSNDVGVIIFERDVTTKDLSQIPYNWDVVVHGNVRLVSNVTIKCNLFVTGNIKADKRKDELYGLSVAGDIFCNRYIYCGKITLAGDLVCGKTVECYEMKIAGELISERVECGKITVLGDMKVDSDIYSSGEIFVGGDLNLKGETYCKILRVHGYVYLENDLHCKLCCIIDGDLYCYGNIKALTTIKAHQAYVYGDIHGQKIIMENAKIIGNIQLFYPGRINVTKMEHEGTFSTN